MLSLDLTRDGKIKKRIEKEKKRKVIVTFALFVEMQI
jgi:hypothetical protein